MKVMANPTDRSVSRVGVRMLQGLSHHSPSPGGEGRGEGGPLPFLFRTTESQMDTRPHPNPLPQEMGLTKSALRRSVRALSAA